MAALRAVAIGRTGRGDWGHAIDEVVASTPGVELVAVADESEEGLAKAVARHGLDAARGFRDWRKMLADTTPDLVAVCMRHVDCHAEMAIAAVKGGAKGVFMEKPFVRTRAEADAVIAACRETGAKLGLAYVNRHAPSFAAVRGLVEDGRIGKVLELRARGKEDQRGGGEDLVVLGCHVLDLMVSLGGAPRWCQATVTAGGRLIAAADAVDGPDGIGRIAGDSIAATFGLADGPVGFFASVRDAGQKQPAFGLTIVGTKGAIHVRPDNVPQAWLREAPPWRTDKDHPWRPIGPQGLDVPPPEGAVDRAAERTAWGRLAVADLLDAIAEDREPETGMHAGRTTVEMVAAVYASALSGGRVTWPLAADLPTLG
ncbi:MAG: Gfo/Idh/MocA family protein [Planctomycetaceae bacterium]